MSGIDLERLREVVRRNVGSWRDLDLESAKAVEAIIAAADRAIEDREEECGKCGGKGHSYRSIETPMDAAYYSCPTCRGTGKITIYEVRVRVRP